MFDQTGSVRVDVGAISGGGGETLGEQLGRIAKTLRSSATGPLVASALVERLGREWHKYEEEANGRSLSACLIEACGKGKHHGWFLSRFKAVEALGESVRRTLHHDAAVWAYRKLPADLHRAFAEAVSAEFQLNCKNPLTVAQARRVAKVLRS